MVKRHDQSAKKDPVYSLIDVLYTQTFAEDQIGDTREHAHSKNFCCHGSTHFQRTAILLIVTICCLSTPLIAIPQQFLPSSLKLPSQKPRIALHVVGASFQTTQQEKKRKRESGKREKEKRETVKSSLPKKKKRKARKKSLKKCTSLPLTETARKIVFQKKKKLQEIVPMRPKKKHILST